MVVLIYAIIMLVSWVGVTLFLIINTRKISFLKDMPVALDKVPPVAVIIAVKDEEADVEEALKSVCRLQYPDFRIVVVNDRSVDNTAAILQGIATTEPRITMITIEELPEGWLGKNHALYKGYMSTTEEWLLFTDADVKFKRHVLQKAMNYIRQRQLDHLVVLPEVTSTSHLFQAMMNVFTIMLDIKLRPWTVSDPDSSSSIGVGAFNFVKRSAYEKSGTHAAISLRPDDDLKLGERIKRTGGRQDLLYGDGEVSLAWYNSLSEFVNGLMKNTYSVFNYRFVVAMAAVLAALLVFVLPVPLLLLMGAPYTWMALAIICCHIILLYGNKGIRARWWHFLLVPFAGLVMAYIVIRASILTERQGGIYWRKSFYSLKELRKQV